MARHHQEVADSFKLGKTKPPSYPTIREIVQSVDANAVALVFQTGVQAAQPVAVGAAVALDGKALGSTMQDCHGSEQDFVMVVHACVQSWAGVIGQLSFHNGKSSEIGAVRSLLEQLDLQQLDLQGVWVTLDALHCQKNR